MTKREAIARKADKMTAQATGKADLRCRYKSWLLATVADAQRFASQAAQLECGNVAFWAEAAATGELARQVVKLADVTPLAVKMERADTGNAALTAERDALACRVAILEAAERQIKRAAASGEGWSRLADAEVMIARLQAQLDAVAPWTATADETAWADGPAMLGAADFADEIAELQAVPF